MATSVVLEVVYWVALGAAYRRGALSTVYPVTRGSAALLGALIGIVILGEQLAPLQLAGVAFLVTGTLAAAVPGAARRSLAPALGIGVLIAAYTFVDRLGARPEPSCWRPAAEPVASRQAVGAPGAAAGCRAFGRANPYIAAPRTPPARQRIVTVPVVPSCSRQ